MLTPLIGWVLPLELSPGRSLRNMGRSIGREPAIVSVTSLKISGIEGCLLEKTAMLTSIAPQRIDLAICSGNSEECGLSFELSIINETDATQTLENDN